MSQVPSFLWLRLLGLHSLVVLGLLTCIRLFLILNTAAGTYLTAPVWLWRVALAGVLQDGLLLAWLLVGLALGLALGGSGSAGWKVRLVFGLYAVIVGLIFLLIWIDAGYFLQVRAHLHFYVLAYLGSWSFFGGSARSAATPALLVGVLAQLAGLGWVSWWVMGRLEVPARFFERIKIVPVFLSLALALGWAAAFSQPSDADAQLLATNTLVHLASTADLYGCQGGRLGQQLRQRGMSEVSASIRDRIPAAGRYRLLDPGFPFLKTTLENRCVLGLGGAECQTDGDHDGYAAGPDCNDSNPAVHPGAVDRPGNRLDEDCDGVDAGRPNVILVVLESFGAQFSAAFSSADPAITPTLNRLASQGLLVRNFYSNGTDTDSSLLSLLCSAHPGLGNVPPTTDATLQLRCLPQIFSELGYQTLEMQSGTLDFLNKREFFPRIGFGQALGKDELGGLGAPGWGITDRRLFTQVSRTLDGQNGQPFFLTLYTVAAHHPWEYPADGGPRLYPEHSFADKFKNLIHYTDAALGEFLERNAQKSWLRNSIVIVTADNGQPLGDLHPFNRANFLHVYDENTRVPLVMWGAGLAPSRLDIVASHVDVAPTLLDLLGIETLESFEGTSLVSSAQDYHNSSALVTSPFDSCLLGLRQGPDKFIRDVAGRTEFLYNVETDPAEQQNLAAVQPEKLKTLEQNASVQYLDASAVLAANRFWSAHWTELLRQLTAARTHETFNRASSLQ